MEIKKIAVGLIHFLVEYKLGGAIFKTFLKVINAI